MTKKTIYHQKNKGPPTALLVSNPGKSDWAQNSDSYEFTEQHWDWILMDSSHTFRVKKK